MRSIALCLLLVVAATPALALALAQRKDCSELKAEIDAKIARSGVTTFTTTIVDRDAEVDGKIVGTCNGGTRKIVYKRGF